jgi:hypothetical protein
MNDECEIPINNNISDLSESDDEQEETKTNRKSVNISFNTENYEERKTKNQKD